MAKVGAAAKGSLRAVGKSFKKGLKVLVPPEILSESSFFGGLNRLGDAVEGFGAESKGSQAQSKQYVIRHSGGAIADTAIGMAFLGMPVTLVTALFSDGCKIASRVLKDASGGHKETKEASEFLGDMSIVSNNFMKLFDIPSKQTAADVHDSIEATADRLNKGGRLTKKLKKDLKELDGLCEVSVKDKAAWCGHVQEKLSEIADAGISIKASRTDLSEVKDFVKKPTVSRMKRMRDGLFSDLKRKRLPVRESTKAFADDFVGAIEDFPTADFQYKMNNFMISQYQLAGKTQDAIEEAAGHGYGLAHSVLSTTYKGVNLFGKHYKKQLKCAVLKECEN